MEFYDFDIGCWEQPNLRSRFFDQGKSLFQFRKSTHHGTSSDEIGLFLRSILREHGINEQDIRQVAFCSVVPDVNHTLGSAIVKYFSLTPFQLKAGVKTGLQIKYRNPLEVGADRIANAIGALHRYPGKNLIIIDTGTATTFCAVTAEREYLGGLIVPGLRLAMEALESKTAQLPKVPIVACKDLVGRSTIESIQSGLYFSHLAAIQGISERIQKTAFDGDEVFIIGTGGFSRLFESEGVFNALVPDLVHVGIFQALEMNMATLQDAKKDLKKGRAKHATHNAEV
jgi:type III pantothenate kinase